MAAKYTKHIVFFTLLLSGWFGVADHVQAVARTWDGGGGNNNWSTAANWSGDVVPGASDTVTFDATSTKDSVWDSSGPATIAGFTATAAYSGAFSITKASVTVAGSWSWAGTGSFDAGTSEIVFTTTGTWTPGNVSYFDIKTNQGSSSTLTVSGTATIAHNFSLAGTNNPMAFSGGTINVAGNVSCTAGIAGYCAGSGSTTSLVLNGIGNQTISSNSAGSGFILPLTINKASGILTLSGTIYATNWTYIAGTVDSGTSTVLFTANFTINSGSMRFYNMTFLVQNNTITLSDNVYIDHNFSIDQASGGITINGFNIYVAGNYSSSATGYSTGSTTVVVMSGSGDQTLSTSGGGSIDNITINKPSGTLTLSGTIPINGNWTHTKGTINPGSSTLLFSSGGSTFTPGSASYNNMTVSFGGSNTLTVSGTATILGNLDFSNSSGANNIASGTLRVFGDVSHSGTGNTSGTIEIAGSGAQILSETGGGSFQNITINKPSGTLTLSGTVLILGNWIWTSGNLDAGTSTLRLYANGNAISATPGMVDYYNVEITPYGSGSVNLSGSMSVRGAFTSTSAAIGSINNGTVLAYGDVTKTGAGILNGTAVISLVGPNNQTLSASTGGLPNISINKTSGTLSLSGTIPVFGNWTYIAGKVNAGTSVVQPNNTSGGTLTFAPGNVVYYDVDFASSGANGYTLGGNLNVSDTLSVTGSNGFISTAGYSIVTKNLIFSGGGSTLNAGSSTIKVSGNISGAGSFTQGTSTVVLNGTGQTVSGTRTFYNLYKLLPVNTTDTLTFGAATTYTIASGGTARFQGSRGNLLSIQSSSAGNAFTLTKTGSVIAEYVSLKDSTISGSTSAVASTNVSGNTNWVFTKEFVSTIRATGGDYTTLSGWEGALGAVDLTASATKVFSHSGITGTIADNSSVTGATSGATGTVIHATSTQILIKSISGTFQSGEQIRVNVSNYVTSSDTGNGAIAVAECYNDWPNALNDSVTISGETTDADNFILIVAPLGQRYMGKLKDTSSSYYNGFTLKPSSSTAIILDSQPNYTRIEGIAIDGTNATATNFRLNGTSPLGVRLLSANGVDGFSLSGGAIVTNSLAYGGTGKCFEDTTGATTNYTVYNSTAYGCAQGFQGNNTTTAITLKNVLASNNSTADYALTNTGAKSVTYSASSDATSDDFGTTTGDRVSQTFSFVDTMNKDYHLLKKDTGAKNFGLDLSTDSTFPIIDDIESDVRPAVNPSDTSEVSYDMGMDEYDYDVTQFKKGVRWR